MMQYIISSLFIAYSQNEILLKQSNLPIVMYWYETRSLTLTEGHRQTEFENRFLMRLFGPKLQQVTGVGGHHCKTSFFFQFYNSPIIIVSNQIKEGQLGEACSMRVFNILTGESGGKEQL
jgi:hypothetical protein